MRSLPARGNLVVVALLAFVGCKPAQQAPTPPQGSAVAKAPIAPPKPAPADPWNQTPPDDPNGLPSLSARAALANTACPNVAQPFFFELTKAGKTAHILGTRHIGVGLAKFPQVVRDTLDSASLAVFEIAPDDRSTGSHTPEPLEQELGPKDWAHFEDLVGKDLAENLKVAEADSAALAMLVLYEDLSNTLEAQLQARLTEKHIPMTGLETSEFQDGVLAKLLDLRMLKATIEQTKDRAEIKHDSLKDLAEYCAGTDDSPGMDAESRAKMLKSGYTAAELDAMDDTLVYKRNADWIPKLSKLFEQDQVFVAVGADHLIGPRGVIELLKAQGFAAKRIAK
jgi:hypothetical protein